MHRGEPLPNTRVGKAWATQRDTSHFKLKRRIGGITVVIEAEEFEMVKTDGREHNGTRGE